MKTPIIFIIFNRPEQTKKVFETIKQAEPEKLIVVADGPRLHNQKDVINCPKTRKIIEGVDWKCQLIKEYSQKNLGCKKRIATGIDKAFSLVDRAIILEDDCLPNFSFFKYCEELLEKYKNDKRIMSLTGDNFLFEKSNIIDESYYFSKYPYIWGWATWRRAWKYCDVKMKLWPKLKKQKIFNRSWAKGFDKAYFNKIDTWDNQWVFTCLIQNGLTIVPNKNLVSNIGFDSEVTHTRVKTIVANMKTNNLKFPLIHPKTIMPNKKADKISQSHFTNIGIIKDYIKNYFSRN